MFIEYERRSWEGQAGRQGENRKCKIKIDKIGNKDRKNGK